jgi:hypothetical protein
MSIYVSKHAIEKYKARTHEGNPSDEQAYDQLLLIAQRGSKTRRCPGDCEEITYNGDAIVVKRQGQDINVITFLGNKGCRRWFQDKEIKPRYARAY